jgi:hypothetical protein
LENLDDDVDAITAWITIRENIRISAEESLGHSKSKQHKLWFDE